MKANAEGEMKSGSLFRSVLAMRESILIVVIAASFIAMSFASPYFLSPQNLESMFLGLSVEGIIAIGMVVLLVAGGLDLSVGSNMAFTGVVVGVCMVSGVPIVPSIIIALAAAFLTGYVNGFLVARMNLNPFITTLGMQMFLKGAFLLLANGKSVLGSAGRLQQHRAGEAPWHPVPGVHPHRPRRSSSRSFSADRASCAPPTTWAATRTPPG